MEFRNFQMKMQNTRKLSQNKKKHKQLQNIKYEKKPQARKAKLPQENPFPDRSRSAGLAALSTLLAA